MSVRTGTPRVPEWDNYEKECRLGPLTSALRRSGYETYRNEDDELIARPFGRQADVFAIVTDLGYVYVEGCGVSMCHPRMLGMLMLIHRELVRQGVEDDLMRPLLAVTS